MTVPVELVSKTNFSGCPGWASTSKDAGNERSEVTMRGSVGGLFISQSYEEPLVWVRLIPVAVLGTGGSGVAIHDAC